MDLEDADAFAFRQDADDAIARYGAAFLKLDRHIIPETADRQHLRLFGLAAAAARPAKLQIEDLGDVEPAFLALPTLAAVALARRRLGRELGVGDDATNDVADRQFTASDGSVHLFDRLLRQARQGFFQLIVGVLIAGAFKGRDQQMPTELGLLPAQGVARRPADGGLGLAGDGDFFPGGRRRLALGDQHLDLIAVSQLRGQGQMPTVDHGAGAGIADVGVDRVGKVDRRGTARQRDQPALWREAEDLVLKQLELGVLEELLWVVTLEQGVDQAAQPHVGVFSRLAAVAAGARFGTGDAVLVQRVGGDAVLGDVMHVGGADLQLDALMARADDGGVDRLVVVLLRRRDVVLEAIRHGAPGRVNNPERAVAGIDAADDDAKAINIRELLERDAAVLHLPPDRERLLLPAVDFGR